MNISDLINIIAAIIILASFPGVIWFFRIRKKMIKRQSMIIKYLEEKLKPKDQTYWYLGYLVGFRAKYRIGKRGIDYIHILYTMPPYHVFFYLPVIWLFRKRERLEFIYQMNYNNKLKGEAHIANTKIASIRLSLKADLKEFKDYKKMEINVDGTKYQVYYKGGEALDHAKNLLTILSKKVRVYRVSVDGSRNSILVSFEPGSLESIDYVLDALGRIANI